MEHLEDKRQEAMPSTPGALLLFKDFRAALTSRSSIGSSTIGTEAVLEEEELISLFPGVLSRRDLKYSSKTSTEIGI